MKRLNQSGGIGVWITGFVVSFVLFLFAAGFGVWAFLGRQDYKDNSDQKVSKAVVIAKQQESTSKDKEFVEKEKQPFKTYKGPATYGSVEFQYPKTWSGYVIESGNGGNPVEGYFHPNVVPSVQSSTAYALRFKVVNQSYDSIMKTFSEKIKSGKITVSAYRAPKVQAVLGSRVDGEINNGQRDSMIMVPLRDKTLQVSTESTDFLNDFNATILATLTFSP